MLGILLKDAHQKQNFIRYNPEKHHRRSIRLQGYDYTSNGMYFVTICSHQRQCLLGEIVDGEMRLSELGQIVRSHWLKLPIHHPHLQLDVFVTMPNHIHGILVLTNSPVGTSFDVQSLEHTNVRTAKPAPTQAVGTSVNRYGIPEIVRGFKTFSARQVNQRRKMRGVPVWQRNYYEHII